MYFGLKGIELIKMGNFFSFSLYLMSLV